MSKTDLEIEDSLVADEEADPIEFWEKKQRELVTSVVDYNLGTLSNLVDTEVINLKPKYQRRFRWDEKRQSRLIESFLMNVPVPPIFLNEDVYGQYSVIDGKQRLTAINAFMKGKLRLTGLNVFADVNGLAFDELSPKLQRVLKTRPTLRAIIILRQSDEDVKFEVFQRVNTGGVSLNPQEIRNSTYPGRLNDLILELSEHKAFHSLLGIKNKAKSRIFQEMRDAEFVLRYLTFRDNWSSFKGGMKRQMDRYMAENQHMSREEIEALREDFLDTVYVVKACFGNTSFRRYLPESQQWRKPVVASLFDAVMFASRGQSRSQGQKEHSRIVQAYQDLFEDEEFRRSIDAATNTPTYFVTRIKKVRDMLSRVLG